MSFRHLVALLLRKSVWRNLKHLFKDNFIIYSLYKEFRILFVFLFLSKMIVC